MVKFSHTSATPNGLASIPRALNVSGRFASRLSPLIVIEAFAGRTIAVVKS